MTEFKPNPFKVKWEELIVKKIANEIYENNSFFWNIPEVQKITEVIITRYKQELEKQKGLKE